MFRERLQQCAVTDPSSDLYVSNSAHRVAKISLDSICKTVSMEVDIVATVLVPLWSQMRIGRRFFDNYRGACIPYIHWTPSFGFRRDSCSANPSPISLILHCPFPLPLALPALPILDLGPEGKQTWRLKHPTQQTCEYLVIYCNVVV